MSFFIVGTTATVLETVSVNCNGLQTFFHAGELVRIKYINDDGSFFCVALPGDNFVEGDTIVFGTLESDQIALSDCADDVLLFELSSPSPLVH